MIRAVFIDYMGTLVQEESEYANAIIGRCFKPVSYTHLTLPTNREV